MQISSDKAYLREKYRHIRAAAKNEAKDDRICAFLLDSEIYKGADTLFIYYSVKSEVDTLKIISTALGEGKRVALPKCIDSYGSMEFYFIKSLETSLEDGYFSLKEPDVLTCEKADFGNNDVCILPAMACDRKGCRLGYGGGYYDRFLSRFNGKTLALCYEECLCDELPCDKYDKKVDMIITNMKIYELK